MNLQSRCWLGCSLKVWLVLEDPLPGGLIPRAALFSHNVAAGFLQNRWSKRETVITQSDKPLLLLYTVSHTDISLTIYGRRLHKSMNTGKLAVTIWPQWLIVLDLQNIFIPSKSSPKLSSYYTISSKSRNLNQFQLWMPLIGALKYSSSRRVLFYVKTHTLKT